MIVRRVSLWYGQVELSAIEGNVVDGAEAYCRVQVALYRNIAAVARSAGMIRLQSFASPERSVTIAT